MKLAFYATVSLTFILRCAFAADIDTIPYRAEIDGLWRGSLRTEVRAQSLTFILQKDPPSTVRQLERRAENDKPVIEAILKARGYLSATVAVKIHTNAMPARVVFHIEPGPIYTIAAFRILYSDASTSPPKPPEKLALKPGRHAEIAAVEEAEAFALRYLEERGYPRPKTAGRDVQRNDADRTVEVTTTIDPGPRAAMGLAEVQGLRRLRANYVRRRVTWKTGDAYDVRVIEDYSKDLLESGLFSAARVKLADHGDTNGVAPVAVTLSERAHRTVSAGGSYRSSEGFGGKVAWENRNLFGGAERLDASLFASEIDYGVRSGFTRPDFLDRNLDLHLEIDAREERPDAYVSKSSRLGASLEKRVTKHLTLQAGMAYEYSLVDQANDSERYGLVSAPIALDWHHRDDDLDPSQGWQTLLGTTPYQDTLSDLTFQKSVGEVRLYLKLAKDPQVVLATRAMAGTISGAGAGDIPADKRFYAGGGGTIRGYKYQSVGVLENGDPVGGDSILTVSMELRAKMTPTLGTAIFVDGGNAFDSSVPQVDQPLQWGAGFGVRYFMKFAPLRADIAFPVNRREGIDPAFQLYFSLGQSF